MLNYLCSFFTYPQLTSTSFGSSEESTDHEHIINKRSAPESEDDSNNDDLLGGLGLQSESFFIFSKMCVNKTSKFKNKIYRSSMV